MRGITSNQTLIPGLLSPFFKKGNAGLPCVRAAEIALSFCDFYISVYKRFYVISAVVDANNAILTNYCYWLL